MGRDKLCTFCWDSKLSVSLYTKLGSVDTILRTDLRPGNQQRRDFALACYKSTTVFLTGGRSMTKVSGHCFAYDLFKQTLTKIAPLNIVRYSHAACIIGSRHYVFGGRNNRNE